MALTTVQAVEQTGALTPSLFNFPDQTTLDTFVQDAINYADAWLVVHLGAFYGLNSPAAYAVLQERGERYIALETIVKTLEQEKVFGTHFPYMSEESANYSRLIDTDWGEEALKALDLWLTIEQINRNFAKPIFGLSSPIVETAAPLTGLDPLELQYADLLDRARGLSIGSLGSVTR